MEMGDSSMLFEHPTFHDPIQVHYNPNPPVNGWMYAMIAVGSAFIIFVIASIYLMCKSPAGGDHTPLRRHPTKTRTERTLLPVPHQNQKDHL